MSGSETQNAVQALSRAHGAPPLRGRLRTQPEDFIVEEALGYAADGAGEHVLLTVQKREANTAWVAQQLARFAGVDARSVGYAGRKDRHALTTQSFSVHLPGRSDPDWGALQLPGVRVLAADLGCPIVDISIKATTSERLGFTGRSEGIAAQAVTLLLAAT